MNFLKVILEKNLPVAKLTPSGFSALFWSLFSAAANNLLTIEGSFFRNSLQQAWVDWEQISASSSSLKAGFYNNVEAQRYQFN